MDAAPHYCDYISIKGHRRPCPPGAACTVFKPRTHEGHGAWRKKRQDALKEGNQERRSETPSVQPAVPQERKTDKSRIPPEVLERARALLMAGESTKSVADQVGISKTTAYKLQQELIAQGKMKRPVQPRKQYVVRTVWPRKEVFRGDVKACANFLNVAESYVKVAIYKGQIVHEKYMIARVQTNKK